VIELAFQTYTIDHRRPNLASDSIDLNRSVRAPSSQH
jgi:hypothetical protein